MFSTAFMVLLVLCLIGLSIQLGWLLIHLLLVIGFGGAGNQPIERVTNAKGRSSSKAALPWNFLDVKP